MKIIRRRRIVKTKTCAFRQWQSEGQEAAGRALRHVEVDDVQPEHAAD